MSSISEDRKKVLQPLIEYLKDKLETNQSIRLNFICTHNSRRSHLSQVWAQTLADYFKIKNVCCYSGGTEATALFPVAAKTLEETGFKIEKLSNELNPVYAIKYAENAYYALRLCEKKTSMHKLIHFLMYSGKFVEGLEETMHASAYISL